MTRPKPLLFATALLSLGAAVRCQDDGQVLGIINHLRSHDLAQVARGAHEVDVQGLESLVPELRKTLKGLASQTPAQVRFASMALFDALVQLKATLPPDEIEPWLSGHTLPAAMVLMARQPKNYERLLLDIFETYRKDKWNSEYWLAAGNLLASQKSKNFASRILTGFKTNLTVNLYDEGADMQQSYCVGLGGGAGARSSGRIRIPPNYPPVALYRLRKSRSKARLLAPGAKPIYYQRLVSQSYRTRSFYTLEDATRRKLEWICALLDIKMETQPFQLWDGTKITWKDADAYERKIEVEKKKVQGSFHSLINRMQLKGLVTKAEAAHATASVSVVVCDHRQTDTTPLPEIEGVTVQSVKQQKQQKKKRKKK